MATTPLTQSLVGERAERAAFTLVRAPRAAHVLTRVLLALVGAAVLLAFAPWQQTAVGHGRVVAFTPVERQQFVEAPIEGRVVRWEVREGSRVKKGDLLVELSDNDPQLLSRLELEHAALLQRLEAARARAEALAARAEQLSGSRTLATSAAEARVAMARDRTLAAQRALEATEAAHRTSSLNLERQKRLAEGGLTATRALELAELEAVRAGTEVDRARVALSAARSEEAALRADQGRVGNDVGASVADARASRASALSEVASAQVELARMDVRLARQRTQEVRAPMDATVLRLVGGLGGEMLKAGDPLVVLVPDTESRAVELWMEGNDVPLLADDRRVRLQFEGWPAVQFSGWPSVAVGTFGGKVALIDSTDDGKGKFRILVVPDEASDAWPSAAYLRQGVRVNGWVFLNEVTVGFELWRRFNGFPPVVDSAEPAHAQKKEDKG
ncbi:biotin/lipoyl-binding protein [Myxococcus sp. AM009]|uniref:HlyD family secretion protein n=1 Tax=unclassified Myxococcus TaxID=2648731 RepID=UPI0015957AF0|nr:MULTISPECIES: biotin/lipoyl-binding protein [unclassified Myxococcus]NVI97131.1 biotin/lipoyl-binding protein [Myxococcus sp. AM009]NVJ13113.1 biotin/lipoyl-binding protein [Myxococcus sp. AM010]